MSDPREPDQDTLRDAAEERKRRRGNAQCACGYPDMPGYCPGPRNCPMVGIDDRMTTKSKGGRPALTPGTRAIHAQISLDQASVDLAKAIGDGNVSRGVRLALARAALEIASEPETKPSDEPI